MTTQHATTAICAFIELGDKRHQLEAYAVDGGILCRPLKGHGKVFSSFAAAVHFAHRHGYLS